MDVTDRWRELLQLPENRLPLDEAAFLIAAHANPHLDIASQLRRLDDLAALVGEASIERLCSVLFETYGLRGDRNTYEDPSNSFLDQVLDRRLGIPISLSVLVMEVGRRCELSLEGVGMPGHFLLRDPASPDVLIDAFDRGRQLRPHDCEQLLKSAVGADARFHSTMLAKSGNRAILARMLANLARIYSQRSDQINLIWVTRLRATIPGLAADVQVELANRFVDFGCFDEAARLLHEVSTRPDIGKDTSHQLQNRATAIWARLN